MIPVDPLMTEPLDLDAIERRANAATPGPWATRRGHEWVRYVITEGRVIPDVVAIFNEDCSGRVSDAVFIANARTDVPALVAEIRRLTLDSRRTIDRRTDDPR